MVVGAAARLTDEVRGGVLLVTDRMESTEAIPAEPMAVLPEPSQKERLRTIAHQRVNLGKVTEWIS